MWQNGAKLWKMGVKWGNIGEREEKVEGEIKEEKSYQYSI